METNVGVIMNKDKVILSGGDEGVRVCIYCENERCKNYWECMCAKEWKANESFWIDGNGKCASFEEGECEWYKLEEECENDI